MSKSIKKKTMTPPTKLEDWPDVIPVPARLHRWAQGGCCVSMYLGKVLGDPSWKNGRGNPTGLLKKLGVPKLTAEKAVTMNDSYCGQPRESFFWLMKRLGYEIVDE